MMTYTSVTTAVRMHTTNMMANGGRKVRPAI